MQKVTLFNIFKVFFKIGAILLGGGYVIVPILKEELVIKKGWINNDELLDFYCISQCLPGIIAINTSIFVSYKLMKIKGVLTAIFAIMLSPVLAIIAIAFLIEKIMHISFINSVFYGVNISVIILIYLAIKDVWKKSLTDKFTTIWFVLVLLLSVLKINPIIIILFSIFSGILFQKFKELKNVKN